MHHHKNFHDAGFFGRGFSDNSQTRDARGNRGHDFFGEDERRGQEGRHGRRPRFFGHGELRMVVLDILSQGESHGYELIKAIEDQTGGRYIPSAGVIYPTLEFLQEQGLITINDEDEGARKQLAITPEGTQWIAEHQDHLDHIRHHMKARAAGHQLRKHPQMKRALGNFRAVLELKVSQGEIDDAQIKKIVAVIDRAALELAQLD